MSILDIPGYLQGFRLSDESSDYYDPATKVFHDLAGWGAFNALKITVGTPAFVGSGATRGMTLDNTCQGKFLPACPWQGACIVVMKPDMAANGTIYPVLFGYAASVSSNGKITLQRASPTDYRHALRAASDALAPTNIYTTGDYGGIKVGLFGISQETRKSYATKDGATIVESAAVAAANKMVDLSGKLTTSSEAQYARFGNISGVVGDVALSSNKGTFYEMHWFKDPRVFVAEAAAVQAEIAALKASYGAS